MNHEGCGQFRVWGFILTMWSGSGEAYKDLGSGGAVGWAFEAERARLVSHVTCVSGFAEKQVGTGGQLREPKDLQQFW